MVKKILVQDIVSSGSARGAKKSSNSKDTKERADQTATDRERDFLIERLIRKNNSSGPLPKPDIKTSVKTAKPSSRRQKTFWGSWRSKIILFSSPLILILLILVVLQFFAGATVTVTAKHLTVATSTTLIASNDSSTGSSTVKYQIITLSAIDSQNVPSTGMIAAMPKKASGQITIFNDYSVTSQTLIKNTRFETPEGLIYRTQSSVTIPGQSKDSSGKTVPGSVTITVFADQTGSKYNIGLTDFTLPGLKSDSVRYDKIFGRSKTAMLGGTDSEVLGVADDVRKAAEVSVDSKLQSSLLGQAEAQKTVDSVIFDTATKISFQHLPDTTNSDAKQVSISEQGTISAIIFDKKDIGRILASDAIAKVGNSAEVRGIESLKFTPNIAPGAVIWPTKSFSFTLSGSIDVVGIVDTNKLAKDLSGASRSKLSSILNNYPTIDKFDAVIKPFWKSSFPIDPSKIKINLSIAN